MNKDLLEYWFEVNFPFVALATVNDKDRPQMLATIKACEKHGVPYKKFYDILIDSQVGDKQ